MTDPVVQAIVNVLSRFQKGKIPPAPEYGELNAGLSAVLLELQSAIKKAHLEDRDLNFESMVSYRTQGPMVRITWGKNEGQLTSEEARETAMKLWDVAHASDADAFLVSFLTDKVALPKEHMYQLLSEFREWRERQTELQQKQTPQPKRTEK